MLYKNYELGISKDNLVTVFSKVTAPLCLLGSRAVYFTVNVNYKNDKGINYHGSKDIDLGFHFEKNESKISMINSALNFYLSLYWIEHRIFSFFDRMFS